MRYTLPINQQRSDRGFTLVELLIIAPILILAIGGFVTLMVAMVGDVMATRDQNIMTYETQDALHRIEQDARLSLQFMTATRALSTPQGSNNNYTGNSAFANTSNTLILSTLATNKNPADATRQLVYYANQPNACGSGTQSANKIFTVNVVYFIKDGSLWRRTILPPYNTDKTVDANTVCSEPWQRNSCSPGYSPSPRCATNDVEAMKHVTGLYVQYYSSPNDTGALANAEATEATTIQVTLSGRATTSGREFSTSESLRATKLNTPASTTGD